MDYEPQEIFFAFAAANKTAEGRQPATFFTFSRIEFVDSFVTWLQDFVLRSAG